MDIFRQRIPFQIFVEFLLLPFGEIQHLFMDFPVIVDIIIPKRLIVVSSQTVVQISFREIQIKVRLVEVKNSIMVGIINPLNRVVYSEGAMAERGKKLSLKRPKGDYRNGGLFRKLLPKYTSGCKKNKEYSDERFHGVKLDLQDINLFQFPEYSEL